MGYATNCPGPWKVVWPPRIASTKSARPFARRNCCCSADTVPISRRPQVYTGVNSAVMMCGAGVGCVDGEALEVRKRETRCSWREAARWYGIGPGRWIWRRRVCRIGLAIVVIAYFEVWCSCLEARYQCRRPGSERRHFLSISNNFYETRRSTRLDNRYNRVYTLPEHSAWQGVKGQETGRSNLRPKQHTRTQHLPKKTPQKSQHRHARNHSYLRASPPRQKSRRNLSKHPHRRTIAPK